LSEKDGFAERAEVEFEEGLEKFKDKL